MGTPHPHTIFTLSTRAPRTLRWDLVTLVPSPILGPPPTSRPDGESLNMVRQITSNACYPGCPSLGECGGLSMRHATGYHIMLIVYNAHSL